MSDSRSTEPTPPLGPSTPPAASRPSSGPAPTPGDTAGQPGKAGRGAKPSKSQAKGDDPLRRSRTSGLWIGVIAAGLLLILLIIFIVQNTQQVQVDFLGWSGTPPLAVALLVAAAAGILVTGLVGSLRIFQLRRRVKRTGR